MGSCPTTSEQPPAPDVAPQGGEPVTPWPDTVAKAFNSAPDSTAAQQYCWKLAHSHYENFSVVSTLLPRDMRQDFCNVYAFCRTADDLGDEVHDQSKSLALLDRFRDETRSLFAGNPKTIIFQALADTVERHRIPINPFLDLIDAFEQDQRVDRYDTYADLAQYCTRSANPVGRLVLYLCGYGDATRQQLSDQTCTALQLANFWQDVRRDLVERNRIYLPMETMDRFGLTEASLTSLSSSDAYRDCIRFEVDRCEQLFTRGEALLPMLSDRVRPQVALFGQGGRAILAAIRKRDFDTLTRRPSLSRWQKGRLILAAMLGRLHQVMLSESPALESA